MINLQSFISKVEADLRLNRALSKDIIILMNKLSDKDKVLCKSIMEFLRRKPIDCEIGSVKLESSLQQRILVCRLIPLYFALDTQNPAWSSFLLTQSLQAATQIPGIWLSEIGIAFLEILSEFGVSMNKVVYQFCLDFAREINSKYHDRKNELEPLVEWEYVPSRTSPSAAYLRYFLFPFEHAGPDFVLKTMVDLIEDPYLDDLVSETEYLFEDADYRKSFKECLLNSKLPKNIQDRILREIRKM